MCRRFGSRAPNGQIISVAHKPYAFLLCDTDERIIYSAHTDGCGWCTDSHAVAAAATRCIRALRPGNTVWRWWAGCCCDADMKLSFSGRTSSNQSKISYHCMHYDNDDDDVPAHVRTMGTCVFFINEEIRFLGQHTYVFIATVIQWGVW